MLASNSRIYCTASEWPFSADKWRIVFPSEFSCTPSPSAALYVEDLASEGHFSSDALYFSRGQADWVALIGVENSGGLCAGTQTSAMLQITQPQY